MTKSYTETLSGMAYRPRQKAAAVGASDAAQPREARALVAGRYLPGARLGRGRLGEIFEAIDRNGSDFGIERRVALQLLDIPLTHLPRSAPYYVEDLNDSEPYELDPRDDVYGLACLTYELLGGRHPFNANSPLDAHRAGLTPAPIETLPPSQWAALQRA